MNFKTKSIISRILITVLFPSLSALALLMIFSCFDLNNIFKKLKVKNRTQAVLLSMQMKITD